MRQALQLAERVSIRLLQDECHGHAMHNLVLLLDQFAIIKTFPAGGDNAQSTGSPSKRI